MEETLTVEEFDERFRISYSANGEGLQYYLIDLDDDTAFTLNAFGLGPNSFIAQIYYYGEYKDQIVLTVNVIEEPYSGDYDFYIDDGVFRRTMIIGKPGLVTVFGVRTLWLIFIRI